MLEELDALGAKLVELNARVRALREENVQLRAQLAAGQADGTALRRKVAAAMQRIDVLLDRLPQAERGPLAAPSAWSDGAEGRR